MPDLDTLWSAYAHDRRPANIGESVDGVVLGDIDDEIQDIIGSYMGLRLKLEAWRAARLGLALADVTRVLPRIEPPATREYFERLAALARTALAAIATREA